MILRQTHLLYAQITAIALVTMVFFLFPSAPAIPCLLRLIGVGAIAMWLYRRIGHPTATGAYTLLAAWTLLGIGMALNTWWFTTAAGGTPEAPVLLNNDAAVAWESLQEFCKSPRLFNPGHSRRGFGLFIGLLSMGGTPTIDGVLTLNVLFTLITIVLCGATAALLVPSQPGKASAAAMIAITSVCYFLASGTIFIKDALMCMVLAMVAYAFARLCIAGKRIATSIAVLGIAMAVALIVRPALLPPIALCAAIVAAAMPRRRIAVVVAVIALAIAGFAWTRTIGTAPSAYTSSAAMTMDLKYGTPERLAAYDSTFGEYAHLAWWQKILRLPLSVVVQALTPLPWAFARDTVFGLSQAWAHISYPWYALLGVLLFALSRLRQMPRGVAALFLAGVALTIATAYPTGGTISRYCLMWLPLLVPAAAWIFVSGTWRLRSFKTWMCVYAVLMAIALAVVFAALHHYTPGGWTAA